MRDDRLDTEALKQRLTNEPAPVAYDAELGLVRHRRLLHGQTSLPEWATEPPAASSRWGLRKLGWWLAGALVLVAAASRIAAPRAALDRQPRHDEASAALATAARGASDMSADSRAQRAAQRHQTAEAQLRAVPSADGTPRESPADVVPDDETVSRTRAATPAFALEADASALGSLESAARRAATVAQATRSERNPATSDARSADSARVRRSASLAHPRSHLGRGEVEAPLDAEEMRQLTRAEDLLVTAPLDALALVRAGEVRFRTGYFGQERRYLEVMALFALDRRDEAEARARWFLRDYPDSPYRRRVERARQSTR